jgi:hypothetical protein
MAARPGRHGGWAAGCRRLGAWAATVGGLVDIVGWAAGRPLDRFALISCFTASKQPLNVDKFTLIVSICAT